MRIRQDTTPGGGITGALFISRFIRPWSTTAQRYNHSSWRRSIEDTLGVTSGGSDGKAHLGYAGTDGLRPFGQDIYTNFFGYAMKASPSESSAHPATANDIPLPVVTRAPAEVGAGS